MLRKLLIQLDINLLSVFLVAAILGTCAFEGYRIWQSTDNLVGGVLIASLGPLICLGLSGGTPLFLRRFFVPLDALPEERVRLRVSAALLDHSGSLRPDYGLFSLTTMRLVFQCFTRTRSFTLPLSSITSLEHRSTHLGLKRALLIHTEHATITLVVNYPKWLRDEIESLLR